MVGATRAAQRLQVLGGQVLPVGAPRTGPGSSSTPPPIRPTSVASGPLLSPQPRKVAPADIVFGCGPVTRKYGGPEPAVVNGAVHAALSAGVVEFDTAPLYGDSEDVLGAALAASPLGKKAVIHTKAGKLIRRSTPGQRVVGRQGPMPWVPFAVPLKERVLLPDYSAAGMRRSLEESLQRLAVPRCHTLRLHDPDSVEGAVEESLGPAGAVAGLCQLRQEGVIVNVSLGMNAHRHHKVVTPATGGLETSPWTPSVILDILRGVPVGTFDSVLLAYGWNLLGQDAWPALCECHARGIRVSIAGVFSGLHHLNAGSVPSAWDPSELQAKQTQWKELAQKHGVSLKAVAVAFAMLPTCVDKLVLGMKTATEVEENLAAAAEAVRVPFGIWSEARAKGLLAPELPLPA